MPDEVKEVGERGGQMKQGKHANIYEALTAFQAELKSVSRTKTVKFNNVEFKYAPLDEIANYLYPILGKHGLSYRHEITEKGVECVVAHESATFEEIKRLDRHKDDGSMMSLGYIMKGEIRSGLIPIKFEGKMQDIGSAITYARRYTIALVLGVVTDEDNDIAEESKVNAEKFALSQAKKGIEDITVPEELQKKIEFIGEELKLIQDGKAPKLGLTLENYVELQKVADKKLKELTK